MAVWSWPFLALLCLGNVKFHATEQLGREKRQVSYPQIYQTVKECIEEANNELAIQKQIDKYMMDTGKLSNNLSMWGYIQNISFHFRDTSSRKLVASIPRKQRCELDKDVLMTLCQLVFLRFLLYRSEMKLNNHSLKLYVAILSEMQIWQTFYNVVLKLVLSCNV